MEVAGVRGARFFISCSLPDFESGMLPLPKNACVRLPVSNAFNLDKGGKLLGLLGVNDGGLSSLQPLKATEESITSFSTGCAGISGNFFVL